MRAFAFFLATTLVWSACGDDGSGGSGGTAGSGGSGASGAGASGAGASGAGASGAGGAGASGAGGAGGAGAAAGEGPGGSGGAATGGGGAGAGGGAEAVPECLEDGDCQLVDNCCECRGAALGEKIAPCDLACIQPKCSEVGGGLGGDPVTARCVAGQCVTSLSCDASTVVCLAPQPVCPAGQLNVVLGACWGGCLPERECAAITSCDDCSSASACVTLSAFGDTSICKDPGPCGSFTCECLGAAACVDPFNACSEQAGGLSCQCPTCAN